MSRALNWINSFGVVALATLCAVQWSRERASDIRTDYLEAVRVHQANEIERQKVQLLQDDADLAEFRKRVTDAEKSLAENVVNLATAKRLIAQLSTQQSELKAALATWQAAVSERDAAISTLNQQAKKIVADRDTAISKYNDLVTKSATTTASN